MTRGKTTWRDEWWTKEETLARLNISESTFYRWRRRHTIRTSRLTRRHPLVFNVEDLTAADLAENPDWRQFDDDVTVGTCYAGASARNDTGVSQ